jgi:hypothetical protein
MLGEALQLLDSDIERLLLAGGAVASLDKNLVLRNEVLKSFAQKSPALEKIVNQISKF